MTSGIAQRLAQVDVAAAGETLAQAFQNDPIQVHVFPDPEERRRRSPAQFSTLAWEGRLFGEAFAMPGMTGISVWMPPEGVVTAEPGAKSRMGDLPGLMGNDALTRFGAVLDYLSKNHQKGMPAKTWYLMVVGVHPDHQGRGLGRALLAPIIARADAARTAISLDTAQPNVKPFYEKLGFKVAIESVDPGSGLRLWSYLREPGG